MVFLLADRFYIFWEKKQFHMTLEVENVQKKETIKTIDSWVPYRQ